MPKHAEPAANVDATPCNCLALRQAARHISQLYDQHLAEVGLRTTQYSILSKLGRLGAMPISKLAVTMVMERTALSRAIGPLERDGLVKVGAGPDGRTRSVKLTPTGQARLKAAAAHWRRAQKDFEIAVGAGNAADLRTELQRMISVT
ncbi:MAG: MarR family winged helix-turn-helix transcriptional regulator [Pseudolabrys sp.]